MEKLYNFNLTSNEYVLLLLVLNQKISQLQKKPKSDINDYYILEYKKLKKHLRKEYENEKLLEELARENY